MKKNFCSPGHLLTFGFTLLISGMATGQLRTITGTVTENNHPLQGVSVSQQGSTITTVTSSLGTYSLQVSGDHPVIIFQHPEYGEKTIAAGNNTSVSVSLESLTKGIGEIILNAGYYKVKDKERTGSIAKISAKDIENQPVLNVLSAAQGRMAGVSIIQNSGVPGGGFDIQIRGKNSIRREGNEPLYIIDGVPLNSETPSLYTATILPWSSINPLNAINPEDIESFEVLKDADATAIYGSRGANGVILVTTKKGKKGKTALKLMTSYSLSRVTNQLKLMSTEQYLTMRQQAFKNDGLTTIPASAYDLTTWDKSRDTNWQKTLIGNTSEASSIQLSLSGGSDTSSYLISYGHQEQGTVFPADFKYKTNNLTGNFTFRTPDKRLELNMNNSVSFQNNNIQNDDLTKKSLQLSPNAPALYDASGQLNWEDNTFTNPIAGLKGEYRGSTTFLNNGTNLSYRLFPFLSLKLNGGITYQDFKEQSLKPHTMYNPAAGLTSAYSSSSLNHQSVFSYLLEPQLSVDFSWKDHRLDFLIGTTLQQSETNQGSIQGSGFESNALIQNVGAAKIKTVSDQIRTQYNYTALFSRLNYQYKKRYILNLTARRDGSSRFAPQHRFGNFGAIGGAWIVSQEPWLRNKNLSWLSLFKLRGSIGITGNDKIGDYQYLNTYSVTSSIYDGITGLSPSRLYNPDFSWEKTTKREAALELGLLKNRINLSMAYYNNTSSSQLVGIPLPGTTGFSSIQSNLSAKVQNTGLEFEISAQPLRSSKLKYETSFNLSIPRNKLLEFPGLEGSTYANQYMIGEPMSMVKVYQFEGVDPETGLYRFKDFNGDGRITSPDDNKVIEKMGVQLFGGWTHSFRYKGWSASFLLQFVKQRNWNYNRSMLIPGSMNNQPVEVLDAWSPSNPTGSYMQYSAGSNSQKNTLHSYFQNSSAAVSDASFIRLKNVQLSYSLPVQRLGIREAMIYVQGQNLLTLTKYFGVDPEFLLVGYLPPLKTYSVGFQLSF